MLLSTLVIIPLLAVFAFAFPAPELIFGRSSEHCTTCSTSNAKLVLPAGQQNLTAPTGDPSFVLLAIGYQNYTCSAQGTYTFSGAKANLFDLSCLSESDHMAFDGIQDGAFDAWSKSSSDDMKFQEVPLKLGIHYNIFFNGVLSPVWDFTKDSAPNQPDAFVVGVRIANLMAPTGHQDVDWVQFKTASGGLANSVYRTHTRGGQPPASCTLGSSDIRVKYVAKYWLYGSTVTISPPSTCDKDDKEA